jgi:hypothetical protein
MKLKFILFIVLTSLSITEVKAPDMLDLFTDLNGQMRPDESIPNMHSLTVQLVLKEIWA